MPPPHGPTIATAANYQGQLKLCIVQPWESFPDACYVASRRLTPRLSHNLLHIYSLSPTARCILRQPRHLTVLSSHHNKFRQLVVSRRYVLLSLGLHLIHGSAACSTGSLSQSGFHAEKQKWKQEFRPQRDENKGSVLKTYIFWSTNNFFFKFNSLIISMTNREK